MCGEENEQEPNQIDLLGKNDPIFPPSSSSPLSPDFSERVGKIIGGAGICAWFERLDSATEGQFGNFTKLRESALET